MDTIKEKRAVCMEICVSVHGLWVAAQGTGVTAWSSQLTMLLKSTDHLYQIMKRQNGFWTKFSNSGNSDVQQNTVAWEMYMRLHMGRICKKVTWRNNSEMHWGLEQGSAVAATSRA